MPLSRDGHGTKTFFGCSLFNVTLTIWWIRYHLLLHNLFYADIYIYLVFVAIRLLIIPRKYKATRGEINNFSWCTLICRVRIFIIWYMTINISIDVNGNWYRYSVCLLARNKISLLLGFCGAFMTRFIFLEWKCAPSSCWLTNCFVLFIFHFEFGDRWRWEKRNESGKFVWHEFSKWTATLKISAIRILTKADSAMSD